MKPQRLSLYSHTSPWSHRNTYTVCVWAHIAHIRRQSCTLACGLPWHYLPDITSSAQAHPGIPVTLFHGQDLHFHYSGASGTAQPFSPCYSSSSLCQSSQCCQTGSVSELSCLWAKIQTHLRGRGRLLTQMLLSWSCTSTSAFCLSTLP